jgi:hypothetical protein
MSDELNLSVDASAAPVADAPVETPVVEAPVADAAPVEAPVADAAPVEATPVVPEPLLDVMVSFDVEQISAITDAGLDPGQVRNELGLSKMNDKVNISLTEAISRAKAKYLEAEA